MGDAQLKEVFSEAIIRERVQALAARITRDYAGEPLLMVGVLKGAFIFLADLARAVECDLEVDFVRLSCYGDGQSPGDEVRCSKWVETELAGKHVLIVEDIVDTGRSLAYLKKQMQGLGALSVRVAVLVDKAERREVEFQADYTAFALDSGFIVGYGMDCAEQYRHLKGIYEIVAP